MASALRFAFPLMMLVACSGERAADAVPTWTLRETLRIGEGDEGPKSFSWVKGIAEGADGRVYIYEHSTQDIRVFDQTGNFLKTIGRRGAGPGELANAEGIAFAGDGTLWVRDAANGRFSRFSPDGEVLDAWSMSYCTSQGTWMPRATQDRFIDTDCIPGVGGDYQVIGYRLDRAGIDSLGLLKSCGSSELSEAATWITRSGTSTSYRAIPYAPRWLSTFDATGATWCVPNSSNYEILRLSQSGDTVRVTHSVPSIPVTSAERDSIIADLESRGPTGLDFSRIPATKPAILRVTVDDQDRLWVRRDDPNGGVLFDVIKPDGSHEATVKLSGVQTSTWSPFIVRGDVLLLVILGEDEVPQVGRFEIVRVAPE